MSLKVLAGSSYNNYIFGKSYLFHELKGNLDKDNKIILDGISVNFKSLRLQTFIFKGNVCVECGRVGVEFRLQKNHTDTKYHVGLWSEDNVMMTKDHILPKGKGGRDTLTNMQCMCEICNSAKGVTDGTNINSISIVKNKYPKAEEYIDMIYNYNRENQINVYKERVEFINEVKYITDYAREIYKLNPSKKNKAWKKIPACIRAEVRVNHG